jgi:tetratricopeptide (TPR) repeat protein
MASDNSLIEQAIENYQLGDFNQAAQICHELVKVDPNDYEALHLLGIILHEAGLNTQAADILKQALATSGQQVSILHNYGLVLRAQGKFSAAAVVFRQIVATVPTEISSWYNLGEVEFLEDKFEDAVRAFEKVLEQDPDSLSARIKLGVALRKMGCLEEARNYFQDIIIIDPKNVAAQNNIGIVETELDNLSGAKIAFQTALSVEPSYPDAHFNLGNVYWEERNYEVAAECFQKTLELEENNQIAYYHLALCMQKLKKYAEALVIIDNLIANCGENIEQKAQFLGERANIYRDLGRFNEAIHDIETAVSFSPRDPALLGNKALTLLHAGQIEDAISIYKLAVLSDPGDEEVKSHLAQALLLGGYFREGWREFEIRLNSPAMVAKQSVMPGDIWRGQDLTDKHLLIWCEQGLGDAIQFLRFVSLVTVEARQVTLLCPDRLKLLLNSFDGAITILDNVKFSCDVDFNLPLMSLPYLMGLESILESNPYLFADSNLIDHWDKILGYRGKPRIGIAWQGNPAYEADHQRSIPLSYLQPLFLNKNYEFVSLQRGFGCEQLSDFSNDIVVLGDGVDKSGAFVDTAAIMENLDLVITSDTAIAHLSGALGKPVWLLLPKTPDWRWLLHKDHSPWYANMKIFRQKNAGRWEEVINQITLALDQENFNL